MCTCIYKHVYNLVCMHLCALCCTKSGWIYELKHIYWGDKILNVKKKSGEVWHINTDNTHPFLLKVQLNVHIVRYWYDEARFFSLKVWNMHIANMKLDSIWVVSRKMAKLDLWLEEHIFMSWVHFYIGVVQRPTIFGKNLLTLLRMCFLPNLLLMIKALNYKVHPERELLGWFPVPTKQPIIYTLGRLSFNSRGVSLGNRIIKARQLGTRWYKSVALADYAIDKITSSSSYVCPETF